jgi:hypothetical protein
MRSGSPLCLCLLAAAGVSAQTAPRPEPIEWIVEDGNVLTLRLVLDEKKPCGGELTVDPNRRLIRFEGIPGDIGCSRSAEGPFEAVHALRTQRKEAGFVLELGTDKASRFVLIPLPHYRWFAEQVRVREGGLENGLANMGIRDRDGERVRIGGSSPTATLEKVEIPKEVEADTQKAVDLIREALGRTPAPEGELRTALQGRPIDTTVKELIEEPGGFASQPIRVRARLERAEGGGYRLADDDASIVVTPEPGLATLLRASAQWVGHEIEITGRLRRQGNPSGPAAAPSLPSTTALGDYFVSAWDCQGPEAAQATEGQAVTLEALVSNPAAYEGEVVRVVGKFRGRNVHGDLPAKSQRHDTDWVIKSDRYAVWVTGHKPEGEGWALDPQTASSGEWLEVVGRAVARKGATYLSATRVAITAPPPGAHVRPARMVVARSSVAPVVVFTLPLEGEAIEAGGRIVIQFAKNMDEESFRNRVRLRYVGRGSAAPTDLAVRTFYDESRRSLVIDPGRRLEAGRELEVLLLPGIIDLEGMPLAPRQPVEGAVELIRYVVGG